MVQPPDATVCACATALPARSALLRLSGPAARDVAVASGLSLPAAWCQQRATWSLAAGDCPVRVACFPAGRSYSGYDLVEVTVPGAPDLVELALTCWHAAGAEPAAPGAFSRQALANGRIDLDQAQAVLALSQAPDAAAARQAIARLQGALGAELEPLRQRLLHARALVEAGLDFIEEDDVRAFEPAALQADLDGIGAVLERWRRSVASLGAEPTVCLVGPANAGKSALFAALTGSTALVSAQAGTTRDWLQATVDVDGRPTRIIDTAGWLDAATGLDADGVQVGAERMADAALVLACSAPDARLPADCPQLPADRSVVIATKADLGDVDERAVLTVSTIADQGLDALMGLVARHLAKRCGGDPRQGRLLAEAADLAAGLAAGLPPDEILSADLRRLADLLGDLIGRTTDDDVLNAIFGRFCIGK